MSPSLQTMGFFMSDINFCNTKEQLNHLGEVVTGKVDGSPTGADIDTSTLPYTGQVRKTLPALEEEYQADIDNFVQVSDQLIVDKTAEFDTSIANKEVEADAAIDAYRLLSKGLYAAGIELEDKFQYITYNGESYFAVNPPYTTTATTPDSDGNLFIGGYISQPTAEIIAEQVLKDEIAKYTNISYTSVEDMISGIPLLSSLGDSMLTGGTNWKANSYGPLDLQNSVKASFLDAVLLDDYDGISTDPAADNTPAFNALMNLAVWSSGQKKAFRLSGGTYNFSNKVVIPWNAYSISFFGLGKEVSEFHFDYDGSGVEGNIGLHIQCEVSNFHNMRFSSNDTNRDDMRVVVHETIKAGDVRYADIDAFYTNCTFENGIYGVLCKGRGLNMSQCTFARCFNMIGFDAPNGEFFEPTNPASKHETALRRYYFSNIDGDGCDVLFKNAGDETYSQYLQGIVAVNCGGLAIATFFDGDIANSSFTNMIGYNPVAGSAWNFGTVTNVQINNPTVIGDYDPTHAPVSYTSSYDRFITASGAVTNLVVMGGVIKGTSDRDCIRLNGTVDGLTIVGTKFAEITAGDTTTSNYPLIRFGDDATGVNINGVSIDNTYKSSPGQMGVMYELLNGAVITDSSITGVTQVSGDDEYRQTSDEDFGRFIPDMKCGGVSCTTSVSEGEFSKHGDIVTGTILIVVSSFNSTGDITIENLPYPALTSPITGKGGTATIGELTNGTGFTGHVGGRVVDGAIELKQYETATMSLGSVTDSNFTSPPTVLLSFVYSVN